jgi:hypothetical protein
VRFFYRLMYHAQYAFGVSQHVVIPKSQDAISVAPQESVARFIVSQMCTDTMLTTIQLDDEPQRVARKVGKVGANRRLASEMCHVEWRLTQKLP